MGLQIWLPMNGDINNQGLANATITNTGAVVNNNGKIGKCYQFGTGTSYMNINKETVTNISGACSVCFWLNIISWNTNYSTFFQFGKSNDAWESYIMGMLRNSSGSTCCFTISNGTTASNNSYQTSALTTGIWYHVCLVYQPGKCSIYLNGELDHEYTTTIIPDFSKVTKITIGKSYNGYQTNCLMNDFRIYDNALSPREIKEISKGLVLHYPLNREGFGADNLYTGSMDFSGTWTNKTLWATDSESYNGFTVKKKGTVWGGLAQNVPCTNGDVFTISFYARVDLGGNIQSIHRSSLGNVTTGLTILGGNFQSGTVWVSSSGDGTKWKYYWATVQITSSDITYLQWRIENSIADKYLYVCGMKLEVGSKATPWIPHKTDDLYFKMGLNVGNENLLTKSVLNPSNWTHIFPNCTRYTGDGYNNMFEMVTTSSYENVYLPISVTSGQQYTFSVTYQVLDSFTLWQSSRPFSFQILSAVPTNSDTFNNVIGSILIGNTAMSAPQRGSTTFIPTGSTVWLNIPGSYYKDGADSYNKRVQFSHFKLEKGATATPWVSATSDPIKYGNIVYDVSGYKYNGTNIGTITYSGDTPRYQISTSFNGTDNGILIENLPLSNIINTAVTYSFWIKPSSENSGRSVYFGSYSGTSWSIEKTTANQIRGYWNSNPDVIYSGATITDNVWQHICITKNGTSDVKIYINGVLKATSTAAHNALSFPNTFRIGRDTRSSDGTPYKGLMSDFRIYSTALSADDILELYQTGASLSNNGTLLGYEYVET